MDQCGIDHDTARFAAQAIQRWWKKMGSNRYPNAQELLITADGKEAHYTPRFVVTNMKQSARWLDEEV